jgi:hypothetical protein
MPRRPRKPRTPDEQERIERNVDAFLQSELMEETAAYLARGRSHSTVADDELGRRWTAAFKAFFADRSPERLLTMEYLAAELRLRGLETPDHTVQAELEAARAEIAQLEPGDPAIRDRIRKFLDSIDKPDT